MGYAMFRKFFVFALVGTVLLGALVLHHGISHAADADASPFSEETAARPEKKDARVVAVLFSVCQTENAKKKFREVPNIDLLDVNGQPMIMHVYKALCNSKYIQKVVVVAAPEVEEALRIKENPNASFIVDKGDAAENVEFGIDEVTKGDLIMFVPSDLVLITSEGVDRLLKRVLMEKDVDIFFPIVSREACEAKYPDEKRTYAHFEEGQYTGAHIELLRPDRFLDNADKVKAQKDKLYDVYYMRKNTLGIVRFLGLRLTLKYLFGVLSPQDVEEHVSEKYKVTAKALYWDDPDLSTDLSEPADMQMIQRVLEQREHTQSQARPEDDGAPAGAEAGSGA